LFASIKEKQIVNAIKDKTNIDIDPKSIIIKTPIKSLGSHEVEIRLAQDIQTTVILIVEGI
jgi:large subunit ribosomal protein L9